MRAWLKRAWRLFWSPSGKYSLGGIFIVGGVAGIIFWGAFNTFMEYTNTLEFCISCHEMDQLVYQEYKTTIHYKNRTGVRVVFADCHVPKAWLPKVWRKIKASNELYHKLIGSVRSEERRVGKECRFRWAPEHEKKKLKKNA